MAGLSLKNVIVLALVITAIQYGLKQFVPALPVPTALKTAVSKS